MNIQDLVRMVETNGIRRVDLKATDLFGRWQHWTIPPERLTQSLLDEGSGFDGSSLRGFQEIHESDMLLMPDPSTAVIDPFPARETLSLLCDVADPLTLEPYSRDPRHVAQKAEDYLRSTGIADTAYFGPELEFFLFDDVRYQQGQQTAFYYVDSIEAHWNSGREESHLPAGANLGGKIPAGEGYSPAPPFDATADIRAEIGIALNEVGITTFLDHHEVATGGQAELGMWHGTLKEQADRSQWYKYMVRNIARIYGKVATFMPKPIFDDNGSGMHTHQSLWKSGEPIFYDANGYAGLSHIARWYIGGLLTHARAVLAFAAPTTNSYKRLVPGFEAPVNLVYSMRNRSAAIRVPTYSKSPAEKRIEFRPPDASANPYLAFSAMLMAGLDGIQRQIEPGDPVDRNLYDLFPEEAASLPGVPGSLEEALDALEADHEFLMQGDVFTADLLNMWIELKRDEVQQLRLRPTPYEYEMYFNG